MITVKYFKKIDNIAIAIFILVFFIFFSGGVTKGNSMAPTLLEKETFILLRGNNVKVGDVVVFRYDKNTDYVKRVMAKEGDIVVSKSQGLFVNDELVIDSFQPDEFTVTVPVGEVFLVGDNHMESIDSRFFGTISRSKIRGRLVLKFDKNTKMIKTVK